jgi:Protein of unknown function (DUF664)
MDVSSLLLELYGRIPPLARDAVDGVDLENLTKAPSRDANTIAWLVWHAARVQDHHISEILEADQVWIGDGWARRFGLGADPSNTGYGHSARDIATVQPERPEVLIEYLDTVDGRTRTLIGSVTAAELDRIVDRRWDPPVTLGVRLVSIADDSLQHLGQAAYLRGLLS